MPSGRRFPAGDSVGLCTGEADHLGKKRSAVACDGYLLWREHLWPWGRREGFARYCRTNAAFIEALQYGTAEITADGNGDCISALLSLNIPNDRDVFVTRCYTHFDQDHVVKLVQCACEYASVRVRLLARCHSTTAACGSSMSVDEFIRFAQLVSLLSRQWNGRVWGLLPWVLLPQADIAISRKSCQFKNQLSIGPRGEISLCGLFKNGMILGMLPKDRIDHVWTRSPELGALRDSWPSHISGICERCVFRRYCANLCPAYTWTVFGSYAKSFPPCEQLARAGAFPREYLVREVE